MAGKSALVTGITGQDGGYLTELLLSEGYTVHGMIRPTAALRGSRLEALGLAHPGRVLCELAFAHLGLDYRVHVRQDPELFRPVDITETCGDASKARERLGWRPRVAFPELVRMMVDAEVERLARCD